LQHPEQLAFDLAEIPTHTETQEPATMPDSQTAPSGGDSSTKPEVATSNEHVTAPVDDAPDPDEDDLDDLDDMLEEFSTVKIDPKKPGAVPEPKPASASTSASKPAAPTIPTLTTDVPLPGPEDFSEDEFQKQLQEGMAELMGDLDKNVSCVPAVGAPRRPGGGDPKKY
jgi:peroxin-19